MGRDWYLVSEANQPLPAGIRKVAFLYCSEDTYVPPTVEKLMLEGGCFPRGPLPPRLREITALHTLTLVMPVALPSSLRTLRIDHGSLVRLPDQLPSDLQFLSCNGNALVRLPRLPQELIQLRVQINQLYELPDLPPKLAVLWCGYNYLGKLPALPRALLVLCCAHNHLQRLPRKLPVTLACVDYSHNDLSTLPIFPPFCFLRIGHANPRLPYPETFRSYHFGVVDHLRARWALVNAQSKWHHFRRWQQHRRHFQHCIDQILHSPIIPGVAYVEARSRFQHAVENLNQEHA